LGAGQLLHPQLSLQYRLDFSLPSEFINFIGWT
jgi:hypothetical protein